MSNERSPAQVGFRLGWATRICRDRPWYRFSANRVIEVLATETEIVSRVMYPWLGWGFGDVRVPLSEMVSVRAAQFWGFPTVQIEYRNEHGRTLCCEHAFTTLLPFPLVTERGEEFIRAVRTLQKAREEQPRP